jgi:hypothetical protein
MTEKLLQYIWQFQYFNRSQLQTVAGEWLEIICPGKLNTQQGPDFSNAQVKIDGTLLAGSVELHLKTSQWHQHGHGSDANYNNVILHVVYEHNEKESGIPVLELQSRISTMMLERYSGLMQSPDFIPCAASISDVSELVWHSWKERLLAERLLRKSTLVFQFLGQNNFHWEETCWWMLARNFGMKTNMEAFEAIARSIPINLLSKHKTQIHQLEAILFGQASLLGGTQQEDYPRMLWREYKFLKKKYALQPVYMPIHFLRMRPGNFPTVRLAQLAALIQNSVHLFSKLLEMEELSSVRALFTITANDYWHYHYRFDETSSFRKKTLGQDMIDNVIINTIVPLVFAYGLYRKEDRYKVKALNWLEGLKGESNTITRGFGRLGLEGRSAFDSQALLELKTKYCDYRRCLECAAGNSLLRSGTL